MKNIFKSLLIMISASAIFAACRKFDSLPSYKNGNAVVLSSSVTAVSPTAADSLNSVITFSWTSPAYASDSGTFKYILELDSSGRNFSSPYKKEATGALNTSITGKELNNILLSWGFPLGGTYNIDAKIISSYGNNNEQYTSNIITVMVSPYSDSSLLSASASSVTLALNTASEIAVDFNWSPSFNGYTGAVTYTLQYDSAGKDFANTKDIPVGVNLFTKSVIQSDLNQYAINLGIAANATGKLDFRIKAVTALGAVAYSNLVAITVTTYQNTIRLYLPGDYQIATGYGPTNWEPSTAPELIRDQRTGLLNSMYYIYIWLPANAQFKIAEDKAWTVNFGGSNGDLSAGGANFTVDHDGVYRLSFDLNTKKYDIREGRMGFVGGATGANWTPPNVFPDYAMGNAATNLFVGITDFTVDGWKMIDSSQWNDGSETVGETRSYGSNGGSGSTMEVNGPNFPAFATAGTYRVIWDGRNTDNITYLTSPAEEMRLVGDGIQGVAEWNPPTSPQMTYKGNGKWQITATLIAGKDFKFVAGNAWGAFDYEDNSGQSTAIDTPRKIKWDGSDNFKTPATTGSYTITLDEYNQTVTVSQ